MAKKLLLNNMTTTGGDTPTPTAKLTTDQLYCHLDARDISLKNWNDRVGHYDFTCSSLTSGRGNRFNLYGHSATSSNFTFGSFPFSIEFTVTITATETWGGLFSATATNTSFQINDRNNGYYGINSTHMSPTPIQKGLDAKKVNDGTLHVIDFVFQSNTHLIIYLDGVEQADITTYTFKDSLLSLTGYRIGKDSGSRITGYVYSFRFYKKALSEYETRCNCLYEAKQNRTKTSAEAQTNNYKNKW